MQNWAKNKYPNGELFKDLLLPTPPRTWHRRTGGQLKTWTTTITADLEPLSGKPLAKGLGECWIKENRYDFWQEEGSSASVGHLFHHLKQRDSFMLISTP